jgi:hypothetical protein
MAKRVITTSDGRKYEADSSSYIEYDDYFELSQNFTKTKIYKKFIVTDQQDSCFVATVIYDSSVADEVEILRKYRDKTLKAS